MTILAKKELPVNDVTRPDDRPEWQFPEPEPFNQWSAKKERDYLEFQRKLGNEYPYDRSGAASLPVPEPPEPRVLLEFQGGLVSAHYRMANPLMRPGGGVRGRVNEFSPGSRRRLLKLFSRFDISKENPPVFITLTYPAEYPSPKVAKKHRRAFEARLLRHAPGCSLVWRLEFQKRGAPHFHMVVFNLPFIDKVFIQIWWGQIIGHKEPFTRIEQIKNRRKLLAYVSKYVAKSGGSDPGGFNLLTYLHDGEFIHPQTGEKCGSIGRWWGVMNAAALPFAALTEVVLKGDFRGFYNFRRGARHVWSKVSRRPAQGFSLFVENSDRWLQYWFGVVCSAA
jgi:hypothetical protein